MAFRQDSSIVILGAGPVGSVVGAAVASSGRPVTLVEARADRRDQISSDGLRIEGIRPMQARPTRLLASLEPLRERPPNILLLCTKTWSLRALMPELVQVVGPHTLVASFQNGIGPEDELAAHLPREQVARAVLNFAGGMDETSGVVSLRWFNPPNYLGPALAGGSASLGSLARILDGCGLRTELVSPEVLRRQVFLKAILSAALTPLCAVSGITMRQAMSYPHTRALARRITAEGLTVAAAVGYTYGEDAAETCMRYLEVGGDHMPSMWTDLRRGSPTEIEHINGKIVELSLMFHGLGADVNRFFTSAVVTEEIKSGARDPQAVPAYLAEQ
jgi:2-dehydropantoate 2-reductase